MAYSDAEVTEAVIRLAVNKYDYKKTAAEVGVTEKTLRAWEKKYPKKGVPELLERAIERMLIHIPSEWKGHDWGVTLGILLDKYQLLRGQPTERVENLIRTLQEIPDEQLDDLERQFIAAAARPDAS